MIENICLEDKSMYLFIDLENVGYVNLSSDIVDKYKVIAVSSRDKDGLVRYKHSYPNIEVVYLSGTGKQLVDFYIYRNAVQIKVLNSNIHVSVLSKDTGYKLFSGLYGDIDRVVNNLDGLDTPITTTINYIERDCNDNHNRLFDNILNQIKIFNVYDEDRKKCMITLIDLNKKYLDLNYFDISMKDFKLAKSCLDGIRVSKLKDSIYSYFSCLKDSIENEYRLLDTSKLMSLLN